MNIASRIVICILRIIMMLGLATIGVFLIVYAYDISMNIHRLPGFLLFGLGGIFIGFAFLVGFGKKGG